VQIQVGHAHASTTAHYTTLASDYATRTLCEAMAGKLAHLAGGATEPADPPRAPASWLAPLPTSRV
jgi:hypothetical protein